MDSRRIDQYREVMLSSLERSNKDYTGFHDSTLYGLVYYFHSGKSSQDADNLSKPVWDALSSVLYKDDNCIKYRVAGMFDLSENDFQTLDVTSLQAGFASELIDAITSEKHIVYVECGRMRNDLFRFNIE
jgi:hypothetical protein